LTDIQIAGSVRAMIPCALRPTATSELRSMIAFMVG
jgi:hypothetical protein